MVIATKTKFFGEAEAFNLTLRYNEEFLSIEQIHF